MDATTLQAIIDQLFAALEAATAGKPLLHAFLSILHSLAVSLIPTILGKLATLKLPRDPASILSTIIDEIFAALEAATLGKPLLHIVVSILHTLAKQLLPTLLGGLQGVGVNLAA